jgi:hypothetical protein
MPASNCRFGILIPISSSKNSYLDKYYIDSWKVWFSIVIVFNGLGNLSLATMRYRIGARNWFGSLLENFKWTLMLAIFLGGLSLHLSTALLSHMFSINMVGELIGSTMLTCKPLADHFDRNF